MSSQRAGETPPLNLFTPDFGVSPHSYVGREELLGELRDGLIAGPTDPRFTTLLLGARGTGKTVSLNMIEDVAFEMGWIVLSLDAGTTGLAERIARMVDRARERAEGQSDGRLSLREVRRSFGFRIGGAEWHRTAVHELRPDEDLQGQLERLAEHAASHESGVLLTIDELQAGDREELRRLFQDVQHLTKRAGLPLAFVGAGLAVMRQTLLEDSRVTFLQRCNRISLPPLEKSDVVSCLSATVRAAGGAFEGEALPMLAEAAGTWPYRMQLLGYHAWRMADAPFNPIDEATSELAIREVTRICHEQAAVPAWHSLNETAQAVLAVIADLDGEATQTSIANRFQSALSTLSYTCRHLVNAGCVEEAGDGALRIGGLMTVEDVRELAGKKAMCAGERANGKSNGEVLSGELGGAQRCNAHMPRAKAQCVLPLGHKGRHRSR